MFQREGDEVEGFHLLNDGWVSSSLLLKRGKRLIQKIHLPGDMLSTPSMILCTAADTLTAITPATTSFVSYTRMGELFLTAPRVAALFTVAIQMERMALMDSLAATGNARALNQLAGLLLDLHSRLSAVGTVTDDAFDLPLTQEVIGDLLGLTSVHVSRMFGSLESQHLISRQAHNIQLLDLPGLQRLSPRPHRQLKFEPEWLPQSG
ncbi:Crp/Fnr family transcriptional regulator [Sphingomonas sp. RB3P16]|uniref:Crp/Fnr family transcriptional regulator n=1 Tax=Parasphingomonas frigoris TaxID=3096163 RepID=UPI002FC9E859